MRTQIFNDNDALPVYLKFLGDGPELCSCVQSGALGGIMQNCILLALCAVVLLTACASPQKTPVQSAVNRYGERDDSIPRPVVRNRYTGQDDRDGMRNSNRQVSHGANMLAVVKTSQLIDMRYMLDLFEHNSKARGVAEILDKRDRDIRECYSERVRADPSLKGTLTFVFRLSRTVPGLHAIQRKGGSINDAQLEACVVNELARIPLVAYVTGRGTLRYKFNVLQKKQTIEPAVMDSAMLR